MNHHDAMAKALTKKLQREMGLTHNEISRNEIAARAKSKRMTSQQVGDAMISNGYTAVRVSDSEHVFVAPPERTLRTDGWKVLQRNRKWVDGCTITESVKPDWNENGQSFRRFTATIRGFQNFKIWEGYIDRPCHEIVAEVISLVTAVRDRIDSGDESDFYQQPVNRKA